jgi:hypothetical protein
MFLWKAKHVIYVQSRYGMLSGTDQTSLQPVSAYMLQGD